jgi:hypothetical protein
MPKNRTIKLNDGTVHEVYPYSEECGEHGTYLLFCIGCNAHKNGECTMIGHKDHVIYCDVHKRYEEWS